MEKHSLNSCNIIEDIYSAYNKTKINIEDLKFYFMHDYKDIIHSDTIEIELYKNYYKLYDINDYKLYDINDSARILQFYRY